MKDLEALLREIESARSQLERALLQNDNFEQYYLQSTKMDKLLEEYIEATTEKMHRRNVFNAKRTGSLFRLPVLFVSYFQECLTRNSSCFLERSSIMPDNAL